MSQRGTREREDDVVEARSRRRTLSGSELGPQQQAGGSKSRRRTSSLSEKDAEAAAAAAVRVGSGQSSPRRGSSGLLQKFAAAAAGGEVSPTTSRRRKSVHLVVGDEGDAHVEEDVDESKRVDVLEISYEAHQKMATLFELLDTSGNGGIDESDFKDRNGSWTDQGRANWKMIQAYCYDAKEITLSQFSLAMKQQAVENYSATETWSKFAARCCAPQASGGAASQIAPLKQVLELTEGALNQMIIEQALVMIEWAESNGQEDRAGAANERVHNTDEADLTTIAAIKFSAKSTAGLIELWGVLDKDGDGDLTPNDFHLMLGVERGNAFWAKLASFFDEDNSGSIDQDEFKEYFIKYALDEAAHHLNPEEAREGPWNWICELQRAANQSIEIAGLAIQQEITEQRRAMGQMDGTDEPAAAAASVEGEMESVVPNSELAGLLTTEARTYCRAMFNRLVAIGGGGTTIQSSMFALHDQEGFGKWQMLQAHFDADGDGTVDYDEFESGLIEFVMQQQLPAGVWTMSPDTTFRIFMDTLQQEFSQRVGDICDQAVRLISG